MVHVNVVVSEDVTGKSVAQDRQRAVDILVDETREHLQAWHRLEGCLGKTLKESIESERNLTKFIFHENNEGISCDFFICLLIHTYIIFAYHNAKKCTFKRSD